MITRRRFFRNVSATSIALALEPRFRMASAQGASGVYSNPIMGGDHPDASPIRVGSDFYLTHSSFEWAPGLLIWHSLDLVNWRPVAAALHRYYGSIWAPYLCEYNGHFYTYFRRIIEFSSFMPIIPPARGASRLISGSPQSILRILRKTGVDSFTRTAARWWNLRRTVSR